MICLGVNAAQEMVYDMLRFDFQEAGVPLPSFAECMKRVSLHAAL